MYGDQFGEFVCGYWGLKGQQRLILNLLCLLAPIIHELGL